LLQTGIILNNRIFNRSQPRSIITRFYGENQRSTGCAIGWHIHCEPFASEYGHNHHSSFLG